MSTYFSLLLIFFLLFSSDSFETKVHTLNQTASLEAKPHFDKGLLLLHNFEYSDAIEEFIQAQQKDPDFVMAYWGEAMAYDHPIWRDLDIEKSRAALQKLGSNSSKRLAKANTELEKDFVQGTEILFGEGSKPDREKAYSEHMAKMYEKYPANHDVAAFYALSLLAIKSGWNVWEEGNVKAAEITNKILKKDPNHVGALHYLVHADDHPLYAINGLDAAGRYAKVASYAGHALHMPSHIYLALGMWNDVVRSNEISWQASIDRKNKKNLSNDELNYHTHLWLEYGYLQQGRFQRARELIDNQVKYVEQLPSPEARFHLMQMKGHYLFNTNEWNSSIATMPVKVDDLDAGMYFNGLFIDGYRLFKQLKVKELEALITLLNTELEKAKQLQKADENIPVCGVKAYVSGRPTEMDLRVGTRSLNELSGLHAWLLNDMTTAEKFFKMALPKEGAVVVGPPFFLISPYEVYGQFLLANNRPAEAMQQFDKALLASPQRYIGMQGKLTAAKAMNDSKAVAEIKKQMQEILKQADQAAIMSLW